MNVGVMKDYKLRDLRASHTLGWSWNWNTCEFFHFFQNSDLRILKKMKKFT
jgi:hypothetical protein